MESINKIWGERRRILLTTFSEIDLLYIKKDYFCSTHTHKEKINRFVVISGKVMVQTDYGSKTLMKNESWTVYPPRTHRFVALEDSVMVELAFVKSGQIINDKDIDRKSQGGKIIDNEEITLDEMKKKGLLEL